MLRLKAFSALSFASALGIFHLLFVTHRIPYIAVNAVFLLGAFGGYLFPDPASYLMIALSWAVFYPVFTGLYGIDPANAAMPLLIYDGLLLVVVAYKNIIKREETLWRRRVDERERERARLRGEYTKAERIEEDVRAKELAIIKLYEITKRMSEGLRFDDIFNTLGAFLKDNFIFRKCDLLVLKHEDDLIGADRRFSVSHPSVPTGSAVPAQPPDFGKLTKMFREGFRDIYLSRRDNPRALNDLGITDPEVTAFVAIPLLSEKRMVGILAMENLPKEDLERLVILSMQFALETKKVLLYEMVEQMAITDSLTGLYVRRHFYERMSEEMKRSKRHKLSFALLMLDIDDFKRCNDTYGHLVGDVILKDMARVIRENVREIDVVARYGGEEIALVLPETGEENARVVAERLRARIEEHVFRAYDEKLKLTVSAGVSIYPKDSIDARNLIEKADEALYSAKKSGKNLVCGYKR